MILERLIIENFRQFKGRQELFFSDNHERNVTLIHAENGFGKTTLLNAILWALYGHNGLTQDFEGKEFLIHNGLAHEHRDQPTELQALTQLAFKHDGDRYILTRTLTLAEQNVDSRRTKLSLEVMRVGQTILLDHPQRRIQAIVPDGIAKFLFFNGERIDHLGLDENRGQITEAIHQMLGLNLLRRTIEDLNHQSVRGRLRKELSDNTSDEKRDLLTRVTDLEEKQARCNERLSITKAEISAIDKEIQTNEAKLAANKEAHELQTRRAQLQHQLSEAGDRKEDLSKRLAKLIAEDGYTLFTPDLVKRGKAIMKDLREQNMIPAPVIDTFLQQLLDEGQCICERCLEPGSPEFEAVRKRLSDAPNQDFNNAVSALDHAIGILEGVAETTRAQLQQLSKERIELKTAMTSLNEAIEDIHQKIGNKDDEKVKELEEARRVLILKRDEKQAKTGGLQREIEGLTEEITSLNKKIEKIADLEDKAALAQRRVDAVESCSRILEQLLEAETEELRPILNEEIAKHFAKIIDRNYWAELTPDFDLRIRHRIGGESEDAVEANVALSSGQRQVKLLVFIASLLALARRRSEIRTILRGLSGRELPLVVDSPFGQLSDFREGISRWVPNLAPQVIMLVTPKQYDGDVEKALRETGRIGRRYYLAYHGPENTLREGARKQIQIEGNEFQQYFESEEEATEIREFNL